MIERCDYILLVRISTWGTIKEVIDEINDAINKYIAHENRYPYIFMNEDLAQELWDNNKLYLNDHYRKQYTIPWHEYILSLKFNGCKVYRDDNLNHWEVELR